MARTESTMLALGTLAPDFQLPNVVTGETISLETFTDKKALLVIFLCKHCPFVMHIQRELSRLGKDYQNTDLGMIAISANDAVKYPDDSPEQLKFMVAEQDFRFPVCYDETQKVAKIYTAACTPDFFLFNGDRHLVYRGQLDDSRPGNNHPVNGSDLRQAIDATLEGKVVNPDQKPSIGCNIKWKPGNEPSY